MVHHNCYAPFNPERVTSFFIFLGDETEPLRHLDLCTGFEKGTYHVFIVIMDLLLPYPGMDTPLPTWRMMHVLW